MLIQGGIVSPITADAASSATASFSSYPDSRIAGTMIEPTAATSALFEPEMPENTAIAAIITTLNPPCTRPNAMSRKAISRRDMPFTPMTRPARTKNGIASRTKLATPDCISSPN